MARQLRLEFEGAFYHVTARGNAGEKIYLDDGDRRSFLRLLGKEIQQQRWLCYAYCMMDNHYHLLLETPEPNLSRGMRRLNGVYTQTFNRRHQRVGHLFQGRYKCIIVDKESYLLELSRYVVLNPVRAKMVMHEREWPWSSYRATAGLVRAPQWLHVSGVLGLFDGTDNTRTDLYRQFVREGLGQSSPWEEMRGQIFLGREPFLAEMERLAKRRPLDNVPLVQREPTRISQRTILEWVGKVYRLDPATVTTRENAEAYRCAAYLLRRAANVPLNEVAALFGVSASRISHIQRSMESKRLSREEQEAIQLCKVKQ
jgi:REP element-mobilizing transposase RayT